MRFFQFMIENLSQEELAKKLQVPLADVQELPIDEFKSILKRVGKHDFTPDEKFDQDELRKGIAIEKEHTEYNVIAKLIAKDHLSEIPDYYSRLEKMENE